MLTHNDTTVPEAARVYESLRGNGLRYVGFKDIGATPEELAAVADKAHADGLEVFLEVVSTSREAEIVSLRTGREIGVDFIMGGTSVSDGLEILAGTRVRYLPFPGRIEGHPSVLLGTSAEIAADAREMTAQKGVYGLDLLAFRHPTEDPIALTAAVVAASSGPVVVAGSIATAEQIRLVTGAGAWAFTIGGAIFEGRLPGGPGVGAQAAAVLQIAAVAGAGGRS